MDASELPEELNNEQLLTKIDLYLTRSEEEVDEGLTERHFSLKVESGSVVSGSCVAGSNLIEFQWNGMAGKGPRSAFTNDPSLFMNMGPTKNQLDTEEPEETQLPKALKSIEIARTGEAITDAFNDMSIIEKPSAESTPRTTRSGKPLDAFQMPEKLNTVPEEAGAQIASVSSKELSEARKRSKADSTMIAADLQETPDSGPNVFTGQTTQSIAQNPNSLKQLLDIFYDHLVKNNAQKNSTLKKSIIAELKSMRSDAGQSKLELKSFIQEELAVVNAKWQNEFKLNNASWAKELKKIDDKWAKKFDLLSANFKKQMSERELSRNLRLSQQTRFGLNDEQVSSDDSESEIEMFGNQSSLLPPSSNISAIRSEIDDSEDRSTMDALKFVRTHPDRVPRWNDYKNKMCLALFCGRVLYKYAKDQGLHKVPFLSRWLGYAFGDFQERVYMILDVVMAKFPKVGLFCTLKELARLLAPDDFTSLESLEKRKKNETLTDFAIRLLSDIPICHDISEKEVPNAVMRFIRANERDSKVATELRRKLLEHSGKITKEKLFDMVESVDRLVQLDSNECSSAIHELNYQPENNSKNHNENKEILSAIYGLQNQLNATQKNACVNCGKSHNNTRPSGTLWPYCQPCYEKVFTKRSENKKIFAQPRVSAAVCEVCKGPVTNGPSGRPFKKCSNCFNRSKTKNFNIKTYSEVLLENVDNLLVRQAAEAVGADSICEVSDSNKFDPARYRIRVKVSNSKKNKSVKGLLDSGCNTEALSMAACRKLGISHLIKPTKSSAKGVDDRKLPVVGEVDALLNIGNIAYKNTFQVLKNISGYDMMIGTRFMNSNSLMENIFKATENSLGQENVERGN